MHVINVRFFQIAQFSVKADGNFKIQIALYKRNINQLKTIKEKQFIFPTVFR